jgi:hypothetical protein
MHIEGKIDLRAKQIDELIKMKEEAKWKKIFIKDYMKQK